jgi:hypothetical protein
MPTASSEIRQGFAAVPTEWAGVYEFPTLQRIKLVVVHQLDMSIAEIEQIRAEQTP